MKTGIELIAQERKEQIEKHNRPVARDVIENPNGELLIGAIAMLKQNNPSIEDFSKDWRCTPIVHKMVSKNYKERLIIAGALIAAEIDRLQSTK